MSIQTTIVNLKHDGVAPIIHAVENDSGRELKMIISDETLEAGCTGKLHFSRPDFSKYSVTATLSLADNAFTANISQALTRHGKVEAQLKITLSGVVVSSYTFIIDVQKNVSSVEIEQLGYTIEDIQALAERAEAAADDAEQAAANLELDNSLASSTKAPVSVIVGNVLKDISGHPIIVMSDPYKYIKTGDDTTIAVNITTPQTSTLPLRYAIVECEEGDKFTISSSGGNAARGWCFLDSDRYILSRSGRNEASELEQIIAPENTAYLVVNDQNDLVSYYGWFTTIPDLENIIFDKTRIRSRYAGKKLSILGDSIDTFDESGYKIDGYNMYYPALGVTDVNQTWWMQVINNSGMTLEVNASWSGSRVTDTHTDPTYPDFYDRTTLLGEPDVIFVTLGTNDSNANVALGSYDFDTTYTILSESTFRTAYIKGIKSLQTEYPSAEIVCIAEKMKYVYRESIKYIAETLGATFIDASEYTASSGTHPGELGMRQIASHVLYDEKSDKEVSILSKAIEDITGCTIIPMSEQYRYITTGGSVSDPVSISTVVTSQYPWRYAIVECSHGDSFTINSSGGNAPRGWCFVDSSGNILDRAAQNASSSFEYIYAPEDSAYLIINDQSNSVSYKGIFDASNSVSTPPRVQTRLEEIAYFDMLTLNTTGYKYPISSMCIVGDKLCVFTSSNDSHSTYARLTIWGIDFSTATLTYDKYLTHNFGHANTVSYSDQTDTLIMGNGGSSSNTEPNQIYIIENFSTILSESTVGQALTLNSIATVIDIDDLGLDWGKQLNVFWASGNLGGNDLAYAISNDGETTTIRLLQFGKTTSLTYGTASQDNQLIFNGTFNIIASWKRRYSASLAINDAQVYAGNIYSVSGHYGVHLDVLSLLDSGEIRSTDTKYNAYSSSGSLLDQLVTEGIAIKNGLMFLGFYVYTNSDYQKLGIGIFNVGGSSSFGLLNVDSIGF